MATAAQGYDPAMRYLPTILLVLSLPAGAIGYAVGVRLMEALPLPEGAQGMFVLFVPLFIAGLVMVPFLVPFLDRKAKQDLAEHARSQAAPSDDGGGSPGDQPESGDQPG